jgi:hypothetical protein
MKKFLPLIASLCLAALLFTSVYAQSAPAAPAAKPTQHPGNGVGHSGQHPSQGHPQGGPCGQAGHPAGSEAAKVHYNGILTAVGAASVTISTTLSGTVTVDVTDTTCIQMPPRKGVSLSELSAGMRVGVQTVSGAGGQLVAVRIQVHKPRVATFVGTVTAYVAGVSLTLQPDTGGDPLTFDLTTTTQIKPWHRAGALAVGSAVTVQAARDFVTANAPALRIIVHGPDGEDDD